jgi:hypothetical protein
MIDVDGPNCGHYLGLLAAKPLQTEFVKEASYPQDLFGEGLPGPLSVMQLSEDAQKSRGEKQSQSRRE